MSTDTLVVIALVMGLCNSVLLFLLIGRVELITKLVLTHSDHMDATYKMAATTSKNLVVVAEAVGNMMYQQAKDAGEDMTAFDKAKERSH